MKEDSLMDKKPQKPNPHNPNKEGVQAPQSTVNRNVTDAFRKAVLQYAQEKRNKR